MTLKQRRNPWGPGTHYETYEEYWEIKKVVLAQQYEVITGDSVRFSDRVIDPVTEDVVDIKMLPEGLKYTLSQRRYSPVE